MYQRSSTVCHYFTQKRPARWAAETSIDSVQRSQRSSQMSDQRLVRERLARNMLHQFGRGHALADAVDFFRQPSAERLELAGSELLIQIAEIRLGLLEELAGVQITE